MLVAGDIAFPWVIIPVPLQDHTKIAESELPPSTIEQIDQVVRLPTRTFRETISATAAVSGKLGGVLVVDLAAYRPIAQ